MSLSAGTRLGPYQIEASLGAGGMGEVYRARDTRLDRTVAIKILAPWLAEKTEARERFDREARTISSLNHPHVCQLYDVGEQDGTHFLVMEYLEGETLAARLYKGPLPIDQVLRYGSEIAEGLDRVHRIGVVHRDLKPGNIMLTRAGAKLMDFGIAKAVAPAPPPPTGATETINASTLPLTSEGTVCGTFQYMSPEQVEGREASSRSDIFALGAVLYEMITGHRAFESKSTASAIAAILTAEPRPLSALQPNTPPALEHVVRRAMAKDADERWQSARDVAAELKWIAESDADARGAPPGFTRSRRDRRLILVLSALMLVLGAVATSALFRSATGESQPMSLEITMPPEQHVWRMSISPDSRKLALVLDGEGKAQIWVRDLNSFVTRPIPGTENSTSVFWSPDSQALGFFANGKIMRTDLQGARTQVLADSSYGFGGDWSADGVIVFTPYYGQGLFRVSAGGGTPAPLTRLDPSRHEVVHTRGVFLPDGQHILFLNRRTGAPVQICWTTLDSGTVHPLLEGDALVGYSDPGYIVFVRRGSLLAQAFDPSALKLKGDPFVLAERVGYRRGDAAASATVSHNGVVAFQTSGYTDSQFVIFDRSGRRVRPVGPIAPYIGLSLAPNEKQFVVSRSDPTTGGMHLWIADLERDTFTRLSTSGEGEIQPIWTPDGSRIVFGSDRNGMYNLFQVQASGAGDATPLLVADVDSVPLSFAPDGHSLVYLTYDPVKGEHAWLLSLAQDAKPAALLPNEKVLNPTISPDGHWIAYQSDDSGRPEVYVTSFPTPSGKTQASTSGGLQPRWRRDGKELFFVNQGDKLTAVDVIPGARVQFGMPHELFPLPEHASGISWLDRGIFEVFDKGQHFLVHEHVDVTAHQPVRVLLNWVPTQKK